MPKKPQSEKFWPRRDLNTQPSDLESDALPLRHGVRHFPLMVDKFTFIWDNRRGQPNLGAMERWSISRRSPIQAPTWPNEIMSATLLTSRLGILQHWCKIGIMNLHEHSGSWGKGACGLMDKAPDFGSGDCRFESCHARSVFAKKLIKAMKMYSLKIVLTPTWFEHAAFWSGVRRATVAPRSQLYHYLCALPNNYCRQSHYSRNFSLFATQLANNLL